MANPASHPEGGVDYPRTLTEFDAWFVSETACAEFLGRVRWPEGFRCPSCCGTDAWPTARGQLRCNRCQRQTSVTAGTIFEGTRKPLRLWFQAMWYVTNQKHGVSALGLQRILGLGSYQTAWAWLHKLRRAMVRPGRDLLGGAVEVDETYVGGRMTCSRSSRRTPWDPNAAGGAPSGAWRDAARSAPRTSSCHECIAWPLTRPARRGRRPVTLR